ncbi:MAG: hypothetical protein WBB36_01190 [Chitinophagales bacterium]
MFHRIFLRFLWLLPLVVIVLNSCKKGTESSPSWNANILAPLLNTSLSLDDLLADSLLLQNSDHSVSLVFSNALYKFSFADQALEIPDTTIKAGFSLSNLSLANQSIIYPLSLGQMCQQLGYLGQFIIAANGGVFPIPPIQDIVTGDNDIDATQFFESADLEAGFIDMTLENGLTIEISNIVFQVKNKFDQQVLTQDTFLNLLPGQTQTKMIDLSGKHVEGTLVAAIIDLDSPGGVALIDTSDALIIKMVAHDLVVSGATAIFPTQNLIDENKETKYNLSGGAQLNQLRVKSGLLNITLQSTIPQQSHFEFALPSATDVFGNSISLNEYLPAAPPGSTSSVVKSFDLSGYTFDLTGINGDEHNTYYSHLVASIDSTGDLVTISKNDSVIILYTLQDIVPEFISGYLGQQIITIGPSESIFDGFKNIKSGTIGLESAAIDLSVKNGIGVSGRINLYELTAINSSTGNDVSLQWDQLNKPLSIAPALLSPFIPSLTFFSLNNSNSTIKSLVENLPDKLKYTMDLFVNPFGNSSAYHDFAYDTSGLEVALNLTIPLSFVANDLVLQDTFDFSLGSQEEGDPAIKEGTFSIIAYNGFPFSATPQLYFYNEDFNLLDSLFTSTATIAAGLLNNQCIVSEKTKSVLTVPADESKMNRLRGAKKVVIRSSFTTTTSGACSSYLKIYDDYLLDIKLTGNFIFYTGY